MIKLPDGTICSMCPRLIWLAHNSPDEMGAANNVMQMDEQIRRHIAGTNPSATDINKDLPHGRIDGRMADKLIYVAPFSSDISESFLLHAHLLMSDTKTLRSCMMLAVNKITGDVATREFEFDESMVIDYKAIAEEETEQPASPCEDCQICPFRGDCNEI